MILNKYSTGMHWISATIRDSLALIISYPNKHKWNNGFIKTPQAIDKSSQLYFARTNRMLQYTKNTSGLTRLHMSTKHLKKEKHLK